MRRIWPYAVLVSLGTHGVLVVASQIIWGPQPLPAQKPPEARLDIAALPVKASTAETAQVAADPVSAKSADGQRVGGSAIPRSGAKASRPTSATAPSLPVSATAVAATKLAVAPMLPVRSDAVQAGAAAIDEQRVQQIAFAASMAQARRPASVAAPSVPFAVDAVGASSFSGPAAVPISPPVEERIVGRATGHRVVDLELPHFETLARRPDSGLAPSVGVATEAAIAARPPVTMSPSVLPDHRPAAAAVPRSTPAAPLPTPSQRNTASLAWSGEQNTLDPISLAAIQAFMQPGDLATTDVNSGGLRDGIADILSAVPCARLQTSFDPETGEIELRGHLPEDGLRAPLLAALQTQVGNAVPVRDRLRLLPRPQCQVLQVIAQNGLAQSTEQETNPRIVGPDTFVRNYDLTAGQQLVFDMTAPDYPAVIYVDYFDVAGNVLHMQPNELVPALLSAPQSTLAVGQSAPDVPALRLIVAPPFGQEIAVAFAASVPLYAGVRPTVEPAEPYLQFLSAAIAQAQSSTPDFKGEWVYFLVTTTP